MFLPNLLRDARSLTEACDTLRERQIEIEECAKCDKTNLRDREEREREIKKETCSLRSQS